MGEGLKRARSRAASLRSAKLSGDARALRDALEKLNWTQADLARALNDALGTSYRAQDVNKWAQGHRAVPRAIRALLAVWAADPRRAKPREVA